MLSVITLNFNELDEENSNYTIEDLYFEDNESSIINLTSYGKYLYLLIFALIVTNILTVFNDRKKGPKKIQIFIEKLNF